MKKYTIIKWFILCSVVGFISDGYSQSVNWLWGKRPVLSSVNWSGNAWSLDNCTDQNGNVIVVGEFDTDTFKIGGNVLLNAGNNYDISIVKYSPTGQVLWAKRVGGTDDDAGLGICTDANNNIIITGIFHSPTINFGNIVLTNSDAVYGSHFIVKYSPAGNVLWAKSTTSGSASSIGICTDLNNNILITGICSPGTNFGNGVISGGSFSNRDMFIVKFSPSGGVVWVQYTSTSGCYHNDPSRIKTDANGNIFINGFFQGDSLNFGFNIPGGANLWTAYLVKFDSAGNLLWARGSVTNHSDNITCNDLDIDANNNVVIVGSFGPATIAFGSTSLTNINSPLSDDAFIYKFDPNGNVIWAKNIYGDVNVFGSSCVFDQAGNIYVSGTAMDDDSVTIEGLTLTIPPANYLGSLCDALILAKYDPNGNLLCATVLGNGGNRSYLAIDPAGNTFVSGNYFSDPLDLGNISLSLAGAYNNTFTAKFEFTCTPTAIPDVTGEVGISVYPNPVQDEVVISGLSKPATLFIFDATGKQVLASRLLNNTHTLQIKNISSGLYFLKIVFDNGEQTVRKMVKD